MLEPLSSFCNIDGKPTQANCLTIKSITQSSVRTITDGFFIAFRILLRLVKVLVSKPTKRRLKLNRPRNFLSAIYYREKKIIFFKKLFLTVFIHNLVIFLSKQTMKKRRYGNELDRGTKQMHRVCTLFTYEQTRGSVDNVSTAISISTKDL